MGQSLPRQKLASLFCAFSVAFFTGADVPFNHADFFNISRHKRHVVRELSPLRVQA